MTRSLLLFFLSFLLWIPLAYIVVHLYDSTQQPVAKLTTTVPNSNVAIQSSPPVSATNPISKPVIESSITDSSKSKSVSKVSSSPKVYTGAPTHSNIQPKYKRKELKTTESYRADVSWKEFLNTKFDPPAIGDGGIKLSPDIKLNICGPEVQAALKKPGLSPADYQWCEWALSSSGGQVVVSR